MPARVGLAGLTGAGELVQSAGALRHDVAGNEGGRGLEAFEKALGRGRMTSATRRAPAPGAGAGDTRDGALPKGGEMSGGDTAGGDNEDGGAKFPAGVDDGKKLPADELEMEVRDPSFFAYGNGNPGIELEGGAGEFEGGGNTRSFCTRNGGRRGGKKRARCGIYSRVNHLNRGRFKNVDEETVAPVGSQDF